MDMLNSELQLDYLLDCSNAFDTVNQKVLYVLMTLLDFLKSSLKQKAIR